MSKLSLKSDYVRNMDFSSYLYNADIRNLTIDENIKSIMATTRTNTALYNERLAALEQSIKDNLNFMSLEQSKVIIENPQVINITAKNNINIIKYINYCKELIKYNTDNVSTISDIYNVINTQKNLVKKSIPEYNIEFNILISVIIEAEALPSQDSVAWLNTNIILSNSITSIKELYINNRVLIINILKILNDIYNKTSELNILKNTLSAKNSSIIQYYRDNILNVLYQSDKISNYIDTCSLQDVNMLAKNMSDLFITKLTTFKGVVNSTNTITSLPNNNTTPYTPEVKQALSTLQNTDVTKDFTLFDNLSVVEYQQNSKPYMYWLAYFTNKCARDISSLCYNIYVENLASYFLRRELPDTLYAMFMCLLSPINTLVGLPDSILKSSDIISYNSDILQSRPTTIDVNKYSIYLNQKDENDEYHIVVSTKSTEGDINTDAIVDENDITMSESTLDKDGNKIIIVTYTPKNSKEIKCNVEYLINKYNSEILPIIKKTVTGENNKYVQTITFSDNTTKTIELDNYVDIQYLFSPNFPVNNVEEEVLDFVIESTRRIDTIIQKTITFSKNADNTYTKKVVYFPKTTTTTYTLYKITTDGKLKQYNETTLEFDETYDKTDIVYKLLELAPLISRKSIINNFITDYNVFLNNYFNNTPTEESYAQLLNNYSFTSILNIMNFRYNNVKLDLKITAADPVSAITFDIPTTYFGNRIRRTFSNIRHYFNDFITRSGNIADYFLLTFRDSDTEKSVIKQYIDSIINTTSQILNNTWFSSNQLSSISQFSIPFLDTIIMIFRSLQPIVLIPLGVTLITLFYTIVFLLHLFSPSAIILVLIWDISMIILCEMFYKLIYDNYNQGYGLYWYGIFPILNSVWCLIRTVFYTLSLTSYPIRRTLSFLFYRLEQVNNIFSGLIKNTLIRNAIENQIPKSTDGLVATLIYY